jgi:nitrate/nitrite transporter NarK
MMSSTRVIFFSINLSACFGWIVISARLFSESEGDLFAVVVCTLMAFPAVVAGVAELLLFSQRAPWLERPLGIVAGIVGAAAVFGFLANVGEVIHSRSSPDVSFWLVFGGACLAVAGYSFWCCWLRLRRRTFAEPRGFPVEAQEAEH